MAARLCEAVRDRSSRVASDSGALPVYQLPLEEEHIHMEGCRWFRFGEDSLKPNRSIMFVGARGAGKSTLIDAMINHILGVAWDDQYRFKLVREGQKETSEVTVYKLNFQDDFQTEHSLTIIDTPGFGDAGGLQKDRETTEKIQNLFTGSGLTEVDAVCFVAPAALDRLTSSQIDIFFCLHSIFSEDIANNITVMVTFADGQRPRLLEAITAAAVPCPQENGEPLHFKFSALFATNKSTPEEDDDDDFEKMVWNMGNRSMKRFFNVLKALKPRSVRQTQDLLNEGEPLETKTGDTGEETGDTGEETGDTAQETGDTGEETGDTGEETGDTGEETGDTGEERGDTGEERERGDSGEERGDTGEKRGHTGEELEVETDEELRQRALLMLSSSASMYKYTHTSSVVEVHTEALFGDLIMKTFSAPRIQPKYKMFRQKKVTPSKDQDKAMFEDLQQSYLKLMKEASDCLERLAMISLTPDPLSSPEYISRLIEEETSQRKQGRRGGDGKSRDLCQSTQHLDRPPPRQHF